jgi:hypothetical protein
MLRSLILGLSFFTAADAVAQPSLIVSPDELSYPAESTFIATNAGADALALSFPLTRDGFYGTVAGYGWRIEVETPDSLYEWVYLPFEVDPLPTIPLGPSDTATFRITGFDPCPVCATEGGGGLGADTLYLRSADASGADTARVILDLSGYVSSEPSAPAAPSLRVSAYPNPVRHTLAVAVEPERGGATDVAVLVVDALGREVRRFEGVAAAGRVFRLDVRGLPAGAYVLRVEAGPGGPGSTTAVRPFVVVR